MERHTVSAAEQLAKTIIANYDNPLQDSSIDVPGHVESLLKSLGASASDSGGKVTRPIFSFPGGRRFHFRDPNGNELAAWVMD